MTKEKCFSIVNFLKLKHGAGNTTSSKAEQTEKQVYSALPTYSLNIANNNCNNKIIFDY